jgi:hypothetical protein
VADASPASRAGLRAGDWLLALDDSRHADSWAPVRRGAGARGNLVPDAWFAALAIESGSEWVTTDRDYARFPDLHWRHPLDA